VRAMNREKARIKDAAVVAEWMALTADPTNQEKLSVPMVLGDGYYHKEPEPWLDFALRAWGYCGMAGHARYLKEAKRILAGAA